MARGDEILPPQQQWRFRFGDRKAEQGWTQCVRQMRANAAGAWNVIVSTPRQTTRRQHRLKGSLSTGRQDGKALEQWQYEITAGGRLWYLVDDDINTVWLVSASLSHPKATE